MLPAVLPRCTREPSPAWAGAAGGTVFVVASALGAGAGTASTLGCGATGWGLMRGALLSTGSVGAVILGAFIKPAGGSISTV